MTRKGEKKKNLSRKWKRDEKKVASLIICQFVSNSKVVSHQESLQMTFLSLSEVYSLHSCDCSQSFCLSCSFFRFFPSWCKSRKKVKRSEKKCNNNKTSTALKWIRSEKWEEMSRTCFCWVKSRSFTWLSISFTAWECYSIHFCYQKEDEFKSLFETCNERIRSE